MYQILCDDYVIHDPRIDELKVIDAKCDLEVNKTGALTFQIHPLHPYYNVFKKHISNITLLQDEEVLFRGRVLNDDITFEKTKTIECEGVLSYLLDSIHKPKTYTIDNSQNTIESCLTTIINNHNSIVDDFKKFKVGNVTVTYDDDNRFQFTANYDDTLSLINKNLIDNFGGYLIVRYEGNDKYLDYITDYTNVSNQTIMFGKNIIDMKTSVKGENIYTAIISEGKKPEEGHQPKLYDYPDGTYEGMIKVDNYMYNPQGVEKYGWIWKYAKYDTLSSRILLKNTIAELQRSTNEEFTLEMTALDLHLIDVNINRIKVGDLIQTISDPHGINVMMLVKSMSINVDDPSKTTVKLVLPEQSQYLIKNNLTDSMNDQTKNNDQYNNEFDNVNKEIKNINTSLDNLNTSVGDLNQGMDDMKQWVSDNFYPLTGSDGGTVDLSDYAKNADVDTKINDLKDWTDTNYVPKSGEGSIDLSAYAKIVDVNTAFDELATALGGL